MTVSVRVLGAGGIKGGLKWAAPLLAGAWLASCAPPAKPTVSAEAPPKPVLELVSFNDLPDWGADNLPELMPALRLQCRKLALLPPDTSLGGADMAATYGGRAGQWSEPCRDVLALAPNGDPRPLLEHWFAPYRLSPPALVTGYFEPILPASLHQGDKYQTPALSRPTDLAASTQRDAGGRPVMGRRVGGTIQPYFTRAEIEAGATSATTHPVAWLASPIDLFFAQIQGSALLQLDTGGTLRLNYDGRSGRPYTPIGRVLEEQGAIPHEQVSSQTIRAWLEAHPAQAKAVMDRNESYVFFRPDPDADPTLGPPGALGVALTAGRSAAVDKAYIPLAAPLFIDSTVPDGRPWRHLVLAQDLGSAIAGPSRVDVFLGAGPPAEAWAGRMHQQGQVWILLPRATIAAR